MNSSNDKRSKRTKISKKTTVSITTNTYCTEGKRKYNLDSSDSENKILKKIYSLPANGNKEIRLQTEDFLRNSLVDSPLCDFNDNITNRSLNTTSNLTVLGTERRKSLRPQAIHNNKQKNSKNSEISSLSKNRIHTPTDTPELIKEMTWFTFSNYFTPVSKENSPLPLLPWADSHEVWEVMLQKDREYKRDPLYIRKHPKLRPRMRSVLLDWLIEVSEVYRLHRETFYLAVDFVDRYLSLQKNIAKDRLQLVGVTALFVASKIEEIYPPKLNEFAYVTDGACTNDEILGQEVLLMQSLNWKLSPVTPVSWVIVYLQIFNNNNTKRRKTKDEDGFEFPLFNGLHLCQVAELIDLCCLDIGYLQFSANIIAASALYHIIGKDILETTGHLVDEIFMCIQWLEPFAQVLRMQPAKSSVKQFEKIPAEDAHNIQVHNSGIQLLDYTHSHYSTKVPIDNLKRRSPIVECQGILTPPASTEKDYLL